MIICLLLIIYTLSVYTEKIEDLFEKNSYFTHGTYFKPTDKDEYLNKTSTNVSSFGKLMKHLTQQHEHSIPVNALQTVFPFFKDRSNNGALVLLYDGSQSGAGDSIVSDFDQSCSKLMDLDEDIALLTMDKTRPMMSMMPSETGSYKRLTLEEYLTSRYDVKLTGNKYNIV